MQQLNFDAYQAFSGDWALVTAGNADRFNTMTVSWGGLGSLWGRCVATVYVRPNRYTYEFLENSEYFTISFYPADCRNALALLGKVSGRDSDKVAQAGLTPEVFGQGVTFAQAKRTILCKKLYAQDMDPAQIPEDVKARFYGTEPVHKMYIGQVLDVKEG